MNRDFKGVWFPAQIWLNEEFSLQEKAFLIEIHSLDNEDGCYASNGYFADFFKLSKTRVSQIINDFAKRELINVTILYKEGSKEIDKRIIHINNDNALIQELGLAVVKGAIENIKGAIENIKGTPLESCKDNNKAINNINKYNTKLSKDNLADHNKESSLFSNNKKETNAKRKAKDIATMKGMIQAFSSNEAVTDYLTQYFNIRSKKGLQPAQWQIILDDLRRFAGTDANLAVDKIRGAIAGGYMKIIADWEFNKTNYKKPGFDNTANNETKKAYSNMTQEEKEEFDRNLPRDEHGNLLKF